MTDFTDIEVLQEVLASLDLMDRFSEIIDREGTEVIDGKFEHLDLSDLELTEVPNDISLFDEMITLDLSHNYLDSLPEFLLELTALVHVEIKGNKFPDNNWQNYIENKEIFSEEFTRLLAISKDITCTWCGKDAGYITHKAKESGEWGFSIHYTTMLICKYCSHIEHFYGKRSIF